MPIESTQELKAYRLFLKNIEDQIHGAQDRAAHAVNLNLNLLYRRIGRELLQSLARRRNSARFLERLSVDLRREFPGMKGFSLGNLKCMRAFAEAWPDEEVVPRWAAQIPWGHNVRLLNLVKSQPEREWYIQQTLQHGWSRETLSYHVETGLYRRQGKGAAACKTIQAASRGPLTPELLKDPYNVDLLELGKETQERDLERGLMSRLRKFLIGMKSGFAFVGDQVHVECAGKDFCLDLLFYHLKLRRFVAIDIKLGVFQTEYTGEMNSYLMAVDGLLRQPGDQPSIGIVLCRHKTRVTVEYVLRDVKKPIGVSAYQLTQVLPKKLKGRLPTISELEAELRRIRRNL